MVHVFVALADNQHHGIVPVLQALGNEDDPGRNLYWGAAFGVRTYFKKAAGWKEIAVFQNPSVVVLQRSIVRHEASGTYVVAGAYRGQEIGVAIANFLRAAAGLEAPIARGDVGGVIIYLPKPTLAVYVGHDGLMDFRLESTFTQKDKGKREAIILACISKTYFADGLRPTGAQPLLWTTGLMAPEAYTLEAALSSWIAGETGEQIRERAAGAYAKYQKIPATTARRLLVSGW